MTVSSPLDPAINEYIEEGREILERVSQALNLLSKETADGSKQPAENSETIKSIYRDVHTLKGSSQLFGFKCMAQVSHALEASLDPIRKGQMRLTEGLLRACTKSISLLESVLDEIKNKGQEIFNAQDVVTSISLLVEESTSADSAAFQLLNDTLGGEESAQKQTARSAGDLNQSGVLKLIPKKGDQHRSENELRQNQGSIAAGGVGADTSIRVQVQVLDRILNLVGELVLVRNQLNQYRRQIEDVEFLNTTKLLDALANELQNEVMKTRMQPIESVVGKFYRMVREMADQLNKRIDLTVEGGETELDKSLLEGIRDPLTHLVRNCCDHGIETPEERKKAGKPETGHLLIRSYHEGGQVVIEISDDGRGIHRKKVIQKALEKGLIAPERVSHLSDRQILDFVFHSGFSTADAVTSVSGRGVGMEVVKLNIEKIGGSVEVKSIEGKGTSVQLRIPLTLAIIPALLVKCGKQKIAIPQVKLLEVVKIGGELKVEMLQSRPMFRLRGQLLPLFDLREITQKNLDSLEENFVAVLATEGERFGLMVPEIVDTADIVVKPLSSILNGISVFSGATVLGDGSIALILDVSGIADYGRVLNRRVNKDEREVFSRAEKARVSADIQDFLLFSVGGHNLHSLPLCLVYRLEEFSEEDIETNGAQKFIRYRDKILPLISVAERLGYPTLRHRLGRVPVIVVQRTGRNYGLVVDDISDIITVNSTIEDTVRDRKGILGNLIYESGVVVVIDALSMIEEFRSIIEGKSSPQAATDSLMELKGINKQMKYKSVRILYAEDVAFFRKHVSKVLTQAAFEVTTVEDGQKAIEELKAVDADRYNLIISDIEMPNVDGLELARQVRKQDKLKNIPMIALTTRFRESDVKQGMEAGFNRYLEKLNPDKLISTISELMGPQLRIDESLGEK